MNCLVVDDDELIRIDLEKKIGTKPFLRLVASCSSAVEAAELMMREPVDLIFLDVMMPGMNGMEFLESLATNRPQVIFISSQEQFAVKAFDYEATDFLVKPFTEERFFKAVMKAARKNNTDAPGNKTGDDHIFVKVNNLLVRINIDEILFIEAMADYVTIHTPSKNYTLHSTMKNIQESLPGSLFFRVHNSFIINMDKISQIEDNSVVIDSKVIPVSRSRFKPFMQRLNFIS